MRYGSVCSGIEAATVAWHSLGWEPVWFSEIEPFPCRVLKHHYPEVPNLGDMTQLNQQEIYNNEPIELLVGGTPCQSFSIAGLRGGMDDERGNLALEYCRILIAKQPRWFVWENVPGVFSSNSGKDFACLLSAFTGKEINPEGLGNTGIVEGNGEGYSVAWRVLDAQYFGVPQRRRRVFVVGHLGNDWRPPYAVLFERDSLRRDFEESAKERKGTAGKVKTDSTTAIGTLTRQYAEQSGQDDEINLALTEELYFSQQRDSVYIENDVSSTLSARDYKEATDLVVQAFGAQNSHHQSMNLDDVSPTLDKSKVPAICIQGSMIGRDDKNGPQGDGINESVAFTLNATDKHAVAYDSPMVFDTTQITSPQNGSNPKEEICHALAKGQHVPLLVTEQTEVVACDQADTITVGANQTTGRVGDICATGAIARRLTPLECERLQGFPDNHTRIPVNLFKHKPNSKKFKRYPHLFSENADGTWTMWAEDSPRYASIGNSMAVCVMHWIGSRINKVDKILKQLKIKVA